MGLEYHLEKAKEAVLEAGKIILSIRRTGDLGLEFKPDGSPVTRADKEAELRIKDILLSRFPDHGFEGEESERMPGKGVYSWSCDPIDGTWAYVNHEKTSSVSLALYERTNVILGIVYNPFTSELYAGAEGLEPTLNNVSLPMICRDDIAKAVLNFQISRTRLDDLMILHNLSCQREIGKLVSQVGSTAYNLAQVAEGCHSVYVARTAKPANVWDIAAGVYLVKRVGGMVTDLAGTDFTISDEPSTLVASTSPIAHEKILGILAREGFGKG